MESDGVFTHRFIFLKLLSASMATPKAGENCSPWILIMKLKSRLTAFISMSLLLLHNTAFAAGNRRSLPGGIASIDCTIFPDGTEVLWSVSVADMDKPIRQIAFTITIGGKATQEFNEILPQGQTTIFRKAFFPNRRNLHEAATIKGFASGISTRGVYVYTIDPELAATCTAAYQ